MNRKPYLLAGSDNMRDLEERIAYLWSFGYRPHGSLTRKNDSPVYNLIQPLVYFKDLDERIGEDLKEG